MVAANLHSRGFAVPWVQDQLKQEWIGFQSSQLILGTLTVSAMSRSTPPPRYFKQVQFINSIISLLPVPNPPPNVPEIVASCHGDLSAVMRNLEISHKMSVPPYSAATLTDQFSNWLAKSWLSPSAVLGNTPQAPDAPLNEPVHIPTALPLAPVLSDSPMEDVTIVSPHVRPHVLAAGQQAPTTPLTASIGMAVLFSTPYTDPPLEISSQPSLDAAIAALPSSPPPFMSDTQMLSYALSDPPEASPLRPDSSPADPSIFWPVSAPMSQESLALEALACDFPGISEEITWRILRRHNGDLAAASAELSSLDTLARTAEVLHEAFPAAAHDDIVSTVSDHAGDITAAYVFLSQRYLSAWDPEHTPARLLANATISSSPAPEDFTNTDSDYLVAENDWWEALLKSKSVWTLHDPSLAEDWDSLAPLSSTRYAVSPRFAGYVYSLGVCLTSSSEYDTALAALRALPSFHHVASWVVTNNKVKPALRILPILLEEGLIHPGAAAWLAVAVESHPTLSALVHPFFTSFPWRSASVWASHNKFLHSYADVQRARRVLIPPSVDDGASMVWTASLHDAPSESAAPAGTSLALPQPSIQALDSRSKGKGRARSVSITPYEVDDPQRIVKNPKKSAKAPAAPAPKKSQRKAPSVSKRAVRESKSAKIVATVKKLTCKAPSLPVHEETPEPESEDVATPAVRVIRNTRSAVLAAAASLEIPAPPLKKSVAGSSSSLMSP